MKSYNKNGEYEIIDKPTEHIQVITTKVVGDDIDGSKGIYIDPEIEDVAVDIVAELESDDRPMQIMFGTRKDNDRPLMWYPTDTEQTLHTNTGIIGTMGTGKTQFTKSMITQIHRESKYNVDGKNVGNINI